MFPEFIKAVPDSHIDQALAWWDKLANDTKLEVLNFYEKGDSDPVIELAKSLNEELNKRQKMLLIKKRVLDFELIEFPNKDYYENLIGKEVYLDARGPIFHICKSHKSLRQYLILGFMPHDFSCPLSTGACKMVDGFQSSNFGYWQISIASYNQQINKAQETSALFDIRNKRLQ